MDCFLEHDHSYHNNPCSHRVISAVAAATTMGTRMLSKISFLNKKQYERPNVEEMKICTDFVTKNMAKDLFGSKTKGGL